MKVQLFIPCYMDKLYPQLGMDTIKILEKVGCEVSFNPKQSCCGKPAFDAGHPNEAKEVCTKFLNDFTTEDIIVVPSGSCVGFVRKQLHTLYADGEKKKQAQLLASQIYELSEFLIEVVKIDKLGAQFDAKVAYHDACGALRDAKIKEAPRKLLRNVKGLELIENNEAESCCGFGGQMAMDLEAIAHGMAHTKIQDAENAEIAYLITTDVQCKMHLNNYCSKEGKSVRTLHLAEVLSKF